MNNGLFLFDYDGVIICILIVEGELYFVVCDVVEIFGYFNYCDVIVCYCKGVVKYDIFIVGGM